MPREANTNSWIGSRAATLARRQETNSPNKCKAVNLSNLDSTPHNKKKIRVPSPDIKYRAKI